MGKSLYFFLTKNDLISILENVEQIISLKYVWEDSYTTNEIEEYTSLIEYVELGINKSGEQQEESFLVLEKSDKLIVREVPQFDGGYRYIVDQEKNMDSIDIWPGGIYGDKYLICGHLGTISNSDKSLKIFSIFQKAIINQCKIKRGRYYVGEDAKNLYGKRRFITMYAGQPVEFDLQL